MRGVQTCRVKASHEGIGSVVRKRGLANVPQFEVGKDPSPFSSRPDQTGSQNRLTFDDVLLEPNLSTVVSRKQVSLKTRLSRNIMLNNPIISSNMDSVTEDKMAVAMAKAGGIGGCTFPCPIPR
jgi:hypothetical protein